MTLKPLPRLATLLLPLAVACEPAHATWICHLSEDLVQLVCVADESGPAASAQPVALTEPARPVVQVRGTSFPLDPRREYRVDLWSVPTDLDWVTHLARATICYRSPGCQVMVVRPRDWPADAPSDAR